MTAQIIPFPAERSRRAAAPKQLDPLAERAVAHLERLLANPRTDWERELSARLDARCRELSGER